NFTGFQLVLGREAKLAREAAVMRGDGVFAKTLFEMVRDAFGKAARIDEHERRAVLANELGDAIVDFVPHFMRGDRTEFAGGNFNREVEDALVADLDDNGIRTATASEEMGNQFDWLLGGGEADAHRRTIGESFEPFERKREVRTALIVRDGVNFVDDYGFDGFQNLAAFRGREQNIERFGCSDEDVRRTLEHFAALVHQRLPGADGGGNLGHQKTPFGGELQNFAERDLEIFLNVVAEGFQR